MMVTFISQCEKNALPKTRRVLDAFADRIGDNTWQTVITEEGLKTVHKMLRQTATKSTAISCHWIRSRSRSQLLWVVGNKSKFDHRGVVPVNYTENDILPVENDWYYLPLIKVVAVMAALLHDVGKATVLFQKKLVAQSRLGDPIRHEWISCLWLSALIQSCNSQNDDRLWLQTLASGNLDEPRLYAIIKQQELKTKPLDQIPPVAKLIAFLILSHHRLPLPGDKKSWRDEPAPDMDVITRRITPDWGYENRQDELDYQARLHACFENSNGFLSQSLLWRGQLKSWSQNMLAGLPQFEQSLKDGSYRLILHHARLCLMLGDHFFSSQSADESWPDTTGLFANTDKRIGAVKQKLDEHLVGVAQNALKTACLLPTFEYDPPVVSSPPALKKASPNEFGWQNTAVKMIKTWRKDQGKLQTGFFAVNMASTGCGKTFANAKIMQAISTDGTSLRYILALGLRTLTLQTGDEYRRRVGLDESELAVLIGSKAFTELYQHNAEKYYDLEKGPLGSESIAPLLTEDVHFEATIPEEGLVTVLRQQRDRKFLYAPVLACTIDHLMAATETKRGGRHILPGLRLMSSDLVIDEVDDFTGSDLIAIGRLVHLAGMLGRKVMISSATIPPDLAEGYFNAYRAGWQIHCQARKASHKIGCAWIDEFKTNVETPETVDAYRQHHQLFINKRTAKLVRQPARRKADIIECQDILDGHDSDGDETKQTRYFTAIKQAAIAKHQLHHTIDKKTGCRVSFGVVRIANIVPCVAVGKYLMGCDWPEGVEARVMVYHSQQVLLLRHELEKHLDQVLRREEKLGDEPQAFKNEIIRHHLNNSTASDILFIVAATPVEEIGRDHDFDWAIVEPSSYRSIIQLAGRIRRHRVGAVATPNLALLQYNWKTIEEGDQPDRKYFYRPGYEERISLETHDLTRLVDIKTIAGSVDAVPRIQKREKLNYRNSLVDLEHYVIQQQLTGYKKQGPESLQGYLTGNWFLTALPQALNPFRKSDPTTNIFRMYDPDEDLFYFIEKDEWGHPVRRDGILQIADRELNQNEQNRLWLFRDYRKLLEQQAEQYESSLQDMSLRYGELNFNYQEGREYEYSDQFGLVKK